MRILIAYLQPRDCSRGRAVRGLNLLRWHSHNKDDRMPGTHATKVSLRASKEMK